MFFNLGRLAGKTQPALNHLAKTFSAECEEVRNFHVALGISLLLVGSVVTTTFAADKYGGYIDTETKIVKTPEGFASDDDCWRSSWFYASLIIIHAKDQDLYNQLKQTHGVAVEDATAFMKYYRENCLAEKSLLRAGSLKNNFSRDQLVPLLLLIETVRVHGPVDAKPHGKAILKHIVKIVDKHGEVSPEGIGSVGANLKYCIDVIGDKQDASLSNSFQRQLQKVAFSAALKLYNLQAQAPIPDLAQEGDYSVFNALALVTMQCLTWGKNDDDVKDWRANFKIHADKGWGPAFKLVSGRNFEDDQIAKYKTAAIHRDQDNDILMGQRPGKYLDGKFPDPQFAQACDDTHHLVLDFVILKGLQLAWK